MKAFLPARLAAMLAATMITMLFAGCGAGLDKKLDGSSETAFEKSLEAIRKSAKPEDAAKLEQAMLVLAIPDVSIGYEGGIVGALKKISTRTPEQLADVLMPIVNGKTGREVIAQGMKRKKDEAARQLARVEEELGTLQKLSQERNASKAALAPIEVIEPTLRFSSNGPDKMSVMDFKVKNGLETGLTYLYMRGTVAEGAGGKVLYSDDIKYKLSDEPLLPGVVKALRLPHGGNTKWNRPEVWGKENLVFTIEVVNAEDLAGKKLAAAFTHKDAERLALLESNKQVLTQILAEQ